MDLRLGAHDVAVEDVHTVEGHVEQRVLQVLLDGEAQRSEVVEVVLLRLVVHTGRTIHGVGFDEQEVAAAQVFGAH